MTRERWITIGLVVAVVLSLVPLITIGGGRATLFARTTQNIGHLPLFGWITTLLLAFAWRVLGTRVGPYAQYFGALVVALGLGLATELLQMIGPRDADAGDLFRNVLGAICAIVWWPTFDKRFDGARIRKPRFRALARAAVVVTFLITAVPLVGVTDAYLDRWRRMPVLFDFESENQARFMLPRRVWWQFTPAPVEWKEDPPEHVARVSFSHFTGSALIFTEPSPDWSGHESFYFDVYHPGEGNLEFGVRIDDQHQSRRWSDRFGRYVTLEPGFNRVEISLDDVRQGPVDRELDLAKIHRVVLYPVDPAGGYELYFGPVGLVRSSSTSPD